MDPMRTTLMHGGPQPPRLADRMQPLKPRILSCAGGGLRPVAEADFTIVEEACVWLIDH